MKTNKLERNTFNTKQIYLIYKDDTGKKSKNKRWSTQHSKGKGTWNTAQRQMQMDRKHEKGSAS